MDEQTPVAQLLRTLQATVNEAHEKLLAVRHDKDPYVQGKAAWWKKDAGVLAYDGLLQTVEALKEALNDLATDLKSDE